MLHFLLEAIIKNTMIDVDIFYRILIIRPDNEEYVIIILTEKNFWSERGRSCTRTEELGKKQGLKRTKEKNSCVLLFSYLDAQNDCPMHSVDMMPLVSAPVRSALVKLAFLISA